MSINEVAALSFFGMAQAVTFAAGVLVGLILTRKDSTHDNCNDCKKIKDAKWWHTPRSK
jgi:hypothetical protein